MECRVSRVKMENLVCLDLLDNPDYCMRVQLKDAENALVLRVRWDPWDLKEWLVDQGRVESEDLKETLVCQDSQDGPVFKAAKVILVTDLRGAREIKATPDYPVPQVYQFMPGRMDIMEVQVKEKRVTVDIRDVKVPPDLPDLLVKDLVYRIQAQATLILHSDFSKEKKETEAVME